MSNLKPVKYCPGSARYYTTIYFQIDFIRNLTVFLIFFRFSLIFMSMQIRYFAYGTIG